MYFSEKVQDMIIWACHAVWLQQLCYGIQIQPNALETWATTLPSQVVPAKPSTHGPCGSHRDISQNWRNLYISFRIYLFWVGKVWLGFPFVVGSQVIKKKKKSQTMWVLLRPQLNSCTSEPKESGALKGLATNYMVIILIQSYRLTNGHHLISNHGEVI